MTPEEELKAIQELKEIRRLKAERAPKSPDQAAAERLAPQLDPSLPIAPQVLAVQPATTNPGGDEAAQSDWAVRGADDAKGKTFVYEPPLQVAKQELLSKPELVHALYPDGDITPEEIQSMDESSPIYQAYADHKWDDVRWAAADSGQTAYRVSKMPWLGGAAGGLSPIAGLVTKLRASVDPVLEGAQAFVLGADDAGAFGLPGLQRRATEAAGVGAFPERTAAPGDVIRGGAATGGVAQEGRAGAEPTAVNEMLAEEHPRLHTAGQVAGMFSPANVLGRLAAGGSAIIEGAGTLASRLGGGAIAQGAAKLAAAAPVAAAGGAAMQAGREGVEAASNLARTGDTGTTLGEASGRLQEAALDPMNLALGVGGEALGMAAGRVARGIANSPRYGGNVNRLEQLGGEVKFGKGPVGSKPVEQAIETAKKLDSTPQDVMAEQLAPKIAAAEKAVAAGESAVAKGAIDQAKLAKEQGNKAHSEFKQKFYGTQEGQMVLPPTETVQTSLKMLREKTEEAASGALRPRGNGAGLEGARDEFNADIDGVSTKPVQGAVELSPEEAEFFLSKELQAELMPKSKKPPPPAGGGGANAQGVNVIKGEAPTVPPKGKEARPAGYVPKAGVGTRETVAEYPEATSARNEYGEAMRPYREAQRADNARASRLSAEAEITPEARQEVMGRLEKSWTPAERAAANGHVMARFYEVNDALRTGQKMAPEVQRNYDAMRGAFDKAVEQGNTLPGKTMRGISVTKDELAQLQKAKTITAQGFVSQSNDPKIAKQFSEWGLSDERPVPVLFEINQTSGVPVGKGQGELVHRPGTQYRITGQRMDGDTHVFQVTESGYSPGGGGLGAALEKSAGKSGLAMVPDVVKAMGGDVKKAHEALLAADRAGAIELRPEGGLGRLSKEEEALTIPGPGKTRLSQIRVIDPEKLKAIMTEGIIGGGLLAVSAATGEDETGAAAAAAGGLALALRKRGISKVYATPKRYDAKGHETRIEQLKTLKDKPQSPGDREARELYAAALKDRQQRPLGGKPGGWANVQKGFSDRLTGLDASIKGAEKAAAQKEGEVLKKTPESAHRRLVRYSEQRRGEGPLKQEIEAAGARAGVSEGLRNLRQLDPLLQLRSAMAPRASSRRAPTSAPGFVGMLGDAAALRGLYPGLKAVGAETSPLRGGMLGVRAQQLRKKEEDLK